MGKDERIHVDNAYFTFQGSSGQSFVQTKQFSGPIADITLTSEKYTGKANKTVRWKIIGNVMEIRCTFWGWSGSWGTAALGFNVYVGRDSSKAVPADQLRERVLTLEVSGTRGSNFEESLKNLEGEIVNLELIGQQNNNTSNLELELLGEKGVMLKGEFDKETDASELKETLFILVQMKK